MQRPRQHLASPTSLPSQAAVAGSELRSLKLARPAAFWIIRAAQEGRTRVRTTPGRPFNHGRTTNWTVRRWIERYQLYWRFSDLRVRPVQTAPSRSTSARALTSTNKEAVQQTRHQERTEEHWQNGRLNPVNQLIQCRILHIRAPFAAVTVAKQRPGFQIASDLKG